MSPTPESAEARPVPGRSRPAAASGRPARAARIAYLVDVTLHLVRRDFTTRHRGTLLGWLWSIAPALLQLAVTFFLFSKVLPLRIPNYPAFLLTGILAWTWFARSIIVGATALESRRDLVLRPGFPTVLLPLIAVLVGLVDYLVALPVLLITLAFTTGLHATALLLPLLLAIQLLFTLGIVWALAPLQVYFRDVQHLTGIALMLGFWLTPIFYTRAQVPKRFSTLYDANPMGHLVESYRRILLDGHQPPWNVLGIVAVVALAVAAAGYAVFGSLRESVPEEL